MASKLSDADCPDEPIVDNNNELSDCEKLGYLTEPTLENIPIEVCDSVYFRLNCNNELY